MDLLSYSNATIDFQAFNYEFCKEIHFNNTNFTRNSAVSQGGGVFGYSFSTDFRANYNLLNPAARLKFEDCMFQQNSAKYGSGLFLTQRVEQSLDGSWVSVFNGSIIENNTPGEFKKGSSNDKISALDIRGMNMVIGEKSVIIRNNIGSGLHVTSSLVVALPESVLNVSRNRARRGAGIYIDGNIPVIFAFPNSSTIVENNVASSEGGGIYFEQDEGGSFLTAFSNRDCFISTIDTHNGTLGEHMFDSNITIEFRGNVAPIGSILYGATLKSCSWAQKFHLHSAKNIYVELQRSYNSTFRFDEFPSGTQRVSTRPHRVTITNRSISAYPGQVKNIDVQVLDVFGKDIEALLGSDSVDEVGHNITLGTNGFWYVDLQPQVPVSVKGEGGNSINLSLYTWLNFVGADVTVEILVCPLGFKEIDGECRCSDWLNGHDIGCNREKVELSVPKQKWLGCDVWSNEIGCSNTGDLILLECYFGYCNPRVTEFNQSDHSNLCAEDSKRTGLMCGHCEAGYGVTLGSTKCKKCSNTDLAVVMCVTAVWGLVLIIIISVFGITIEKGWTNMLILFSNIVFPYSSYYLSSADVVRYLLIPARWITLQPAFDICLFHEANALNRVSYWILFPAYLYFLMLIFAALCQCSSFMSKHFAPHKTLITITIMLYVVLFQAFAHVLAPVKVRNLSGTYTSWRWLFDPQVKYFTDLHAFLVVISIILFFVYILFFPILLLSPTLAYRYGKRFKPILDALWAPFKPKYRRWLSVRLLLRITIITFMEFVLFPTDHGFQINVIILAIFLFLQTFIQPFNDPLINFCDNCLILMALLLHFMGFVGHLEPRSIKTHVIVLMCFILVTAYFILGSTFVWYSRFSIRKLLSKCKVQERQHEPGAYRQMDSSWDILSRRDTQQRKHKPTHTSVSIAASPTAQRPRGINFTRIRESIFASPSPK